MGKTSVRRKGRGWLPGVQPAAGTLSSLGDTHRKDPHVSRSFGVARILN